MAYDEDELTGLRRRIEGKVHKLVPNSFDERENVTKKKLRKLYHRFNPQEQNSCEYFIIDANLLAHGQLPFIDQEDLKQHIKRFNIIENGLIKLLKEDFGKDYIYISDIQYFLNDLEHKGKRRNKEEHAIFYKVVAIVAVVNLYNFKLQTTRIGATR